MQLLIYTSKLTPRITYIFNFIFKEILKTALLITDNLDDFKGYIGPKFTYTEHPIDGFLFFQQTSLLTQTTIKPLVIDTTTFGTTKVPFPVKNSELPFDIFAASFYIISRYEEYLSSSEIFLPQESLQYKLKILDIPIIDEWAFILKNILQKKFRNCSFGKSEFLNMPLIKVQLKSKPSNGLKSTMIHFINVLYVKNQRRLLFDKLTGLGASQPAIIDFLNKLFQQSNSTPFYFLNSESLSAQTISSFYNQVQTAANYGVLNLAWRNKKHDIQQIGNELPFLNIGASHQEAYIKLPGSYLSLLKKGITTDFSMGYNLLAGFRAGTCSSFYWYDLQLEKQTHLKVYSYCFSNFTMNLLPYNIAEKTAQAYIDKIKFVGGIFCTTWNLNNLAENVRFKKWRTFYKNITEYSSN